MAKRFAFRSLPKQRVVVELTARRLRAVAAVVDDGGGVRLTATVVRTRPEGLDSLDAEAQWVTQVLDEGGIPRAPCIVSVPREDVVLKRLELPSTTADDIPAMATLAASRELTIDPETAVIDSLPVHVGEQTTEVLCAAMPEDSLHHVRERMKRAGRPARVVTLRLFGAEAIAPGEGAYVVVDISGSHVEMLWVEDGEPRHARGATLPSDELDAKVGSVSLELRRTWLAWRSESGASTPTRVFLCGPTDLVEHLAEPVGTITGTPVELVDTPRGITTGGHDLQQCRSIAGLLLAEVTKRDWIDLNAPRTSPDLAARRRQVALLCILGLVVILGSIWAVGQRRQATLQQELSRVQTASSRLHDPWWRYNRDIFRAGHLELWTGVDADIGADLARVLRAVGQPSKVLLDEVVVSLNLESVEAPKGTAPAEWSVPWSVRLVVDAEAVSRDEAEALRSRLAESETWEVKTSGADAADGKRLPHGMTLRLDRGTDAPEDAS